MQIFRVLRKIIFLTAAFALIACSGSASNKEQQTENQVQAVDPDGNIVAAESEKAVKPIFPYSSDDIREHVVLDYGIRTVRTDPDNTISFRDKVRDRNKCFIVMSKKDYYLYVYEAQGKDTVLIARYDVCFALKKGNKQKQGDMRTPHCTMKNPFSISQIADASSWSHDFGDGRGSIKSYGDYFLRLVTPGHKGIGIHGSTNNRESVPGRASEGCIRLKDEDIRDLRKNYAFVGMKVVIKAEEVDDLPFEIHAMEKQGIERKRHFDPKKTLTNEQIQNAKTEPGRVKGGKKRADVQLDDLDNLQEEEFVATENVKSGGAKGTKGKNMTLEELTSRPK